MNDTDLIKLLRDATPDKKRQVAAILADANTPAPKSTRLITITETAKRLGLARITTYKLIRTGKLRTVTLGADRRVVEQSILDFLGI